MKTLFLVGYMGSGKSTVAKELSLYYGFKHVDLDRYIEHNTRQSISDIFAERGEFGFRIVERGFLGQLLDGKKNLARMVVSLGGGTPCFFDNMACVKRAGITIFLRMKPENIVKRLVADAGRRPLLRGKRGAELTDFVEKQLAERERHYMMADVVVDVDGISTEEILSKIVRIIEKNKYDR